VIDALELAGQAVAAAEGDAAEAIVQAERSGFARFAGSEVHQPTLIENVSVTLRVIRGRRAGTAAGNRVDPDGLRDLARRAGDAALASAEDPDLVEPAGGGRRR
jgi:predicted Zn-dependent protease